MLRAAFLTALLLAALTHEAGADEPDPPGTETITVFIPSHSYHVKVAGWVDMSPEDRLEARKLIVVKIRQLEGSCVRQPSPDHGG